MHPLSMTDSLSPITHCCFCVVLMYSSNPESVPPITVGVIEILMNLKYPKLTELKSLFRLFQNIDNVSTVLHKGVKKEIDEMERMVDEELARWKVDKDNRESDSSFRNRGFTMILHEENVINNNNDINITNTVTPILLSVDYNYSINKNNNSIDEKNNNNNNI